MKNDKGDTNISMDSKWMDGHRTICLPLSDMVKSV